MARWQAVSTTMSLPTGMLILCAAHAVPAAQASPLRALEADSIARQLH